MEQLELLKSVVSVLEDLQLTYMIVGSYGSGAWGEARFTQDIDIVVDLSLADAERLVNAFPLPEYYVSLEAATEAVRYHRQFNLIHPTSGNKVDFMVAGTDEWGRTQLRRRRSIVLGEGFATFVGAPEDIIISKMRYFRRGQSEKHLRDIAGILKVSGEEVDREYVARWAEEFGVTEIWEAILRRVGESALPE